MVISFHFYGIYWLSSGKRSHSLTDVRMSSKKVQNNNNPSNKLHNIYCIAIEHNYLTFNQGNLRYNSIRIGNWIKPICRTAMKQMHPCFIYIKYLFQSKRI